MLDYQKMFIVCFVLVFASILLIGLVESVIKKHKAKKKYFAELKRENKQLKDKIYRLKFNAELRGVNLYV